MVVKALTKDRDLRYQTAADLGADLRRLRKQTETSGPMASVASVAAATPTAADPSETAGPVDPEAAGLRAGRLTTAAAEEPPSDLSGSSSKIDALDKAGARHWKGIVAAVLILGALGMLVMWWMNRGPALTTEDHILLTDFVNTTGDVDFDGTLKKAVAVKLAESPFLNAVADERVTETLRRMGRVGDERVTPTLGREICQRQGTKALLNGEIASLGSNYVVTLTALECLTGDTIASQQVEVAGKEKVLSALGKAMTSMRRDLGESLGSIEQFDAPIEEATTPSLAALKAFTLGENARATQSELESLPFYEQAIEHDPNFALAYARVGTVYGNIGEEGRAAEYQRKAYALRDRVSAHEEIYITYHYHQDITGDIHKANEALERWKTTYPLEPEGYWGLAVNMFNLGRIEESIREINRAAELRPDHAIIMLNQVFNYLGNGQGAEARAIADRALEKGFDTNGMRVAIYNVGALERDEALMREQIAALEARGEDDPLLGQRAAWAERHGRLSEARRLRNQLREVHRRRGLTELEADLLADLGSLGERWGYPDEAERAAREALATQRTQNTLLTSGVVLARLGAIDEVASIAAEVDELYPEDTLVQGVFLPALRAAIALTEGEADEALRLLETPREYERAWLDVRLARAEIYMALDRPEDAIAELRTIVEGPPLFPVWIGHTMVHLQLGRAYLAAGDQAAARRAYQDFLALMKDADEGVPLIDKARAEYETIPGVRG